MTADKIREHVKRLTTFKEQGNFDAAGATCEAAWEIALQLAELNKQLRSIICGDGVKVVPQL